MGAAESQTPVTFDRGGNYGAAVMPGTSGTIAVRMGASVLKITPTDNCTFNASSGTPGQLVTIYITTSGTSSYTMTFGTNFISTGTLATGTVDAKKFAVTFRCVAGGTWAEISRTTAM